MLAPRFGPIGKLHQNPAAASVRCFLQPSVIRISRHRNPSFVFSLENVTEDLASRLLNVPPMSQIISRVQPETSPEHFSSAQPRRTLRLSGDLAEEATFTTETRRTLRWRRELFGP